MSSRRAKKLEPYRQHINRSLHMDQTTAVPTKHHELPTGLFGTLMHCEDIMHAITKVSPGAHCDWEESPSFTFDAAIAAAIGLCHVDGAVKEATIHDISDYVKTKGCALIDTEPIRVICGYFPFTGNLCVWDSPQSVLQMPPAILDRLRLSENVLLFPTKHHHSNIVPQHYRESSE